MNPEEIYIEELKNKLSMANARIDDLEYYLGIYQNMTQLATRKSGMLERRLKRQNELAGDALKILTSLEFTEGLSL